VPKSGRGLYEMAGPGSIGLESLGGTPSSGPPRLKKTPAAAHPLPQGGEGLEFLQF